MENYTGDFDELLCRRDAPRIVNRLMTDVFRIAQMGTCEIRDGIEEIVAYVRSEFLGMDSGIEASMDPVMLAGQLFRGRRCLILQNQGGRHRFIVVPLKNPNLAEFVAIFESWKDVEGEVSGRGEIVSIMDFLNLVMRRNGVLDSSKIVDTRDVRMRYNSSTVTNA